VSLLPLDATRVSSDARSLGVPPHLRARLSGNAGGDTLLRHLVLQVLGYGRVAERWQAPASVAVLAPMAVLDVSRGLDQDMPYLHPDTRAYAALLAVVKAVAAASPFKATWPSVAATNEEVLAVSDVPVPVRGGDDNEEEEEGAEHLARLMDPAQTTSMVQVPPDDPRVLAETRAHITAHVFLALLGREPDPDAVSGRPLTLYYTLSLTDAHWQAAMDVAAALVDGRTDAV